MTLNEKLKHKYALSDYGAKGMLRAFVAVTLLMQYRMVLDWVNKGDWSALADVVPSMFTILCGYVVLMLLANAGAIAVNKK